MLLTLDHRGELAELFGVEVLGHHQRMVSRGEDGDNDYMAKLDGGETDTPTDSLIPAELSLHFQVPSPDHGRRS